MRRRLYDRLKTWKEQSRGESALMIDGARRVGKSYLVEEFAKREYKSYILIDFNRVSEEVKGLFDQYLDHLDMFFLYLSNYAQTPFTSESRSSSLTRYSSIPAPEPPSSTW